MTNQISPQRFWVASIVPCLDVLALIAWGVLLLKYWFTGELNLLIHPNYFWLAVVTGMVLILLGMLKALQLMEMYLATPVKQNRSLPVLQHITLFPPGWSSILLLTTAIIGLQVAPRMFSSTTAIQRGLTESITLTRAQPQSFRSTSQPEQRSLIDWVRTLNVYPEPDAYTGQKVKVQGFVVYPPHLSEKYLLISRFVITCCAADAYPVGLPVKLPQNRTAFKPDTWLEVEGKMITETLEDQRQLTIQASSLKKIDAPKNPYDY